MHQVFCLDVPLKGCGRSLCHPPPPAPSPWWTLQLPVETRIKSPVRSSESIASIQAFLLFQPDRLDSHRPRTQTPSSFSALPSFPPLQKQSPASRQLQAMRADGELLLAALRRYLSMAEPPSHLRPVFNNRMETSGPKKESSKSRPGLTATAQLGSIKEPLTSVDGGFTVLGPHSGSGK